jgi:cell division topological specificity factor
MRIFGFGRRRGSAPVARERLQILLEYERSPFSHSDLFTTLQEEILAAINRHISVDAEKVQVKVDRGDSVSRLAIDVEIPNEPSGAMSRSLYEKFYGSAPAA